MNRHQMVSDRVIFCSNDFSSSLYRMCLDVLLLAKSLDCTSKMNFCKYVFFFFFPNGLNSAFGTTNEMKNDQMGHRLSAFSATLENQFEVE